MLQAALWFDAQARRAGQHLPALVQERLAAATLWLYAHFDNPSGCVPNLGHNDGAHILPLADGTFGDYRPTLQAAACAFLGGPVIPPGPWDEAALWFGRNPSTNHPGPAQSSAAAVLRLDDPQTDSWAALRAVQYHDRPAQADQLHVELWWRGINIACDSGTYRYTAPPPWNNGLARTAVHNTIMVDGQEQMTRAGRFLWLNWAQAEVFTQSDDPQTITAEHNGYHHLGVTHRRSLTCIPVKGWLITDALLPVNPQATKTTHEICLHWLLPDLPWQYENNQLTFQTDAGQATLHLSVLHDDEQLLRSIQIIRAGEVIYGSSTDLPTHGWVSPTYATKIPALSIRASLNTTLPVRLLSEWRFLPQKVLHVSNVNQQLT